MEDQIQGSSFAKHTASDVKHIDETPKRADGISRICMYTSPLLHLFTLILLIMEFSAANTSSQMTEIPSNSHLKAGGRLVSSQPRS